MAKKHTQGQIPNPKPIWKQKQCVSHIDVILKYIILWEKHVDRKNEKFEKSKAKLNLK